MFPIAVIAIGVAVLMLGKRLSVLGAAVGALLGLGLLRLFPGSATPLLQLAVPFGLAVVGFFGVRFARGIIDIVILVIAALGGAAILLGFFDLFQISLSSLDWLLAVVGGTVGLILARRYKEWAMIVLAG